MPPKIYFSDADKQRDLAKKSVQKAKPKALKAQSSKNNAIVRAFKPKLQPVVTRRPVSAASTRSNANNNQRPVAHKAVAQKAANVKRQPVGNANAKPKAKPAATAANVNGKAAKSIKSKLETALQTASAVMRNKNHKNHGEVQQLVDSYKKQWVTEKRFLELLPKLVFE